MLLAKKKKPTQSIKYKCTCQGWCLLNLSCPRQTIPDEKSAFVYKFLWHLIHEMLFAQWCLIPFFVTEHEWPVLGRCVFWCLIDDLVYIIGYDYSHWSLFSIHLYVVGSVSSTHKADDPWRIQTKRYEVLVGKATFQNLCPLLLCIEAFFSSLYCLSKVTQCRSREFLKYIWHFCHKNVFFKQRQSETVENLFRKTYWKP